MLLTSCVRVCEGVLVNTETTGVQDIMKIEKKRYKGFNTSRKDILTISRREDM